MKSLTALVGLCFVAYAFFASGDEVQSLQRLVEQGDYQEAGKLMKQLGSTGDTATLPLLVTSMLHDDKAVRELWCDCTMAIIAISQRTFVRKEDIKPLLEHRDARIAALGKQIWNCVAYQDIPSDLENILTTNPSRKEYLQKEAGTLENWRGLATQRGFDLLPSCKEAGANLRKLYQDCRKRRDAIDASAVTIGHEEWQHQRCREELLQQIALDELVALENTASFDFMVDVIASDNTLAYLGAFHLHKLTGHHFPLRAYIGFVDSGTNVELHAQAAQAWREWKNTLGPEGFPKPDHNQASVEERLTAFNTYRFHHRGDTSGGEFAVPVDQVLSELIAASNRQLIEMLTEVLRAKMLTEEHVQKLIAAAEKDPSEAHRAYLWQVLATSQSAKAISYLCGVIKPEMPEGIVLGFLNTVTSLRQTEVPLLTHIFQKCPSEAVKDAVLDLLGKTRYANGSDESAEDTLVAWMSEHAEAERHRLKALELAFYRPGTRQFGTRLLEEALGREKSASMRGALYAMAIRDQADEWLPRLLDEESDEIQLAGLKAYLSEVESEDDRCMDSRDEGKLSDLLKQTAASAKSHEVAELAKRILSTDCKKDIQKVMRELQSSLKWLERQQHQIQDSARQPDDQESDVLQNFKTQFSTEEIMRDLEEKHGDFAEKDATRKALEALEHRANELVDQILKSRQPHSP